MFGDSKNEGMKKKKKYIMKKIAGIKFEIKYIVNNTNRYQKYWNLISSLITPSSESF
jgi:hypothetical protein